MNGVFGDREDSLQHGPCDRPGELDRRIHSPVDFTQELHSSCESHLEAEMSGHYPESLLAGSCLFITQNHYWQEIVCSLSRIIISRKPTVFGIECGNVTNVLNVGGFNAHQLAFVLLSINIV